MLGHHWADDGPLLVIFEYSLSPHQRKNRKKKIDVRVEAPLKTFLDPCMNGMRFQ